MSICSAPGCGAACQRGQLMCRTCWFSVPAPLRREVNNSWRCYRATMADPEKTNHDALAAIKVYRAARDAAIAATIGARP